MAENLDMRISSDYSWLIDLNSSLVTTDPRFVLRFKPHVVDPPNYNSTGGTWGQYSRGFVVALSSSSSSTSPPTPSTSTLMSTSPDPASTTSLDASPEQITSSGLSVGAKAGVGVGAAVGALFLVAFTVVPTRQYLSRSRKKEASAYNSTAGQWPYK